MFCVKCGTKNESGAFCVSCGAPLEVLLKQTGSSAKSSSNSSSELQSKITELLKKPAARFSAIGAGAVVLILVLIGSGVLAPNPLQKAYEDCSLESVSGAELADGGKTLLVDTKGEEEVSGASYFDYLCVLTSLETPSRITARMDQTSSLDGQQTDSADGLTYFWKYHPDSGIRLTVSRD